MATQDTESTQAKENHETTKRGNVEKILLFRALALSGFRDRLFFFLLSVLGVLRGHLLRHSIFLVRHFFLLANGLLLLILGAGGTARFDQCYGGDFFQVLLNLVSTADYHDDQLAGIQCLADQLLTAGGVGL